MIHTYIYDVIWGDILKKIKNSYIKKNICSFFITVGKISKKKLGEDLIMST